eukprot:GEMP01058711.1.p1 GENE.GEMP01058711.1~~GEMP01058711.1.p1  ORF type:complete len:129 (+),score=26.23 GEMP01058711.1:104-490(+)
MADVESPQVSQLKKPKWHKVMQVDPIIKRCNLICQVIEVNPVEGKPFAEVVVADDTGRVTCRFREGQLPLAKVGAFIRLQNVRVSTFQEHIRLEIDKWAKLASHEKQEFTIDQKNDISRVVFRMMSVG